MFKDRNRADFFLVLSRQILPARWSCLLEPGLTHRDGKSTFPPSWMVVVAQW